MAAISSLPDQPWSEAETALYQAMLADTVSTLAAVRAFTGAARIPEPDQVPQVAAADDEPDVDWTSTMEGMIAVADALASLTPQKLAPAPTAPAGADQGAASVRPEESALQAIHQVTQQAESTLAAPGMPLAFDAHSVPSPGGATGSPMPLPPGSHEPHKPASGLAYSQQLSAGDGAQTAPHPLAHSSLRGGAQPAPSSHASAPAARPPNSSASAASGGWSLGRLGNVLGFGSKAEPPAEPKSLTVAMLLREKHGHSTKTPGATPAPRPVPVLESSGLPPVPESATATASAAASGPAAPQASPGPSTPNSARALQLAVSAEDHFTSSSAGSPVRGGGAAGCVRCAAALQQLHEYHHQQVRSARQLSSALMRYSRWLRHHAALRGRDVLAAALAHTDTPGGGGDSSRDGTRRRNYSMNTLSRRRRSESGAAASAKSSPTQRGSFGAASDGRPSLQAPSGKQTAGPRTPWWSQPTQTVADITHTPMYSLLAEVPAQLRELQVCAVDVPPGAPAWMLPELGATQIQSVVQQLRVVTEQRDLAQAKVQQLEEQVRSLTERLDVAARQASGPGMTRSMAMMSLPPGARNAGLAISSPVPRAGQLSSSQRSRQSTASSSFAAPERNAFGDKHLLHASRTSGGYSLHSSRRTQRARQRADSAGSAGSCAGESVASGGADGFTAVRPEIHMSPSRAISGLSGIATDDSGHAVE